VQILASNQHGNLQAKTNTNFNYKTNTNLDPNSIPDFNVH